MDRSRAHRARGIGGAVLCALLLAPVHRAAGSDPVELGVYTPRLELADNAERTSFARKVAEAIEQATGMALAGRAFARAEDLSSFVEAGRIGLALVDVATIAAAPGRYRILAAGSGPEGTSPAYAVLSPRPLRGLNALEGRRIALVDSGAREAAIVSNFALEGELAVGAFFSSVARASDIAEIRGWLRSGRADCTTGYASTAKMHGLHVVARLRGFPLPLLVEVGSSLTEGQRRAIASALEKGGIRLPAAGLQTALVPVAGDSVGRLLAAAALEPGQRPVRRAIWAPAPIERLPAETWHVEPRGTYPLPNALGRWRVPELEDIR